MKHYLTLLVLLFFCLSSYATEKDDGYVIERFVYEAEVHPDNSWTVTETINVNFLESRHGIYQYILDYFNVFHDDKEFCYSIDVDNINVVGGKAEILSEDYYTVVRIGDENQTITGPKTYVISYTLKYYDDRYEGNDLLFHSILGSSWTTNVEDYEYKIKFDTPFPAGFADSIRVYSGSYGNDSNLFNVTCEVNTAENTISGRASNVMYGNGITLWAQLPNGFWKGAKTINSTLPMVLFGIATLLFVYVFILLMRNRRREPVRVIEYNAPDGISSAEVGYIIDNTADVSDLTSLIVWWASKGFIKIQEDTVEDTIFIIKKKKTRITLVKLCNLPETAPAYQQKFWDIFFGTSDTCCVNDLGDEHVAINSALEELGNSFTGTRNLYKFKVGMFLLVLLFVLCGAAAIMMSSSVELFSSEMVGFGICWAIAMVVIYVKCINLTKKDLAVTKLAKTIFFVVVSCICAFLAYCLVSMYEPCNMSLPLYALVSILIEGFALIFLIPSVISDTEYRIKLMSLLLGFKEFIRCSELPMLKAMVDENPNYFYDVLPYAMVFGLSDKWQEQFKTLEIQPPTWYENDHLYNNHLGPRVGFMVADSLNKSFNDVIKKSIEASSIDPTASSSNGGGSGFSDGGFSGGGGGGGGGGSW